MSTTIRTMTEDGGFTETTEGEQRHSIELTMAPNGKYKPVLKMYFADNDLNEAASEAVTLLNEIELQLGNKLFVAEPPKGAAKE